MKHIPAECLHTVWDWVRPGLEVIRTKHSQSWLAEDVYFQLANKTAFLAVLEDKGFIVYQVLPGDDRRGILHVWCLWGPLKEDADKLYKEMDEYAKTLGVRCIRAFGRKGWSRTGYFKLVAYVYERELK